MAAPQVGSEDASFPQDVGKRCIVLNGVIKLWAGVAQTELAM